MCKWKSKQVYGFFQIWALIWIINQFTSTRFKTMFWIVSIFSIAEDNRKKKTLIPFKFTNYDSFPVFRLHIMSRISVEVKITYLMLSRFVSSAFLQIEVYVKDPNKYFSSVYWFIHYQMKKFTRIFFFPVYFWICISKEQSIFLKRFFICSFFQSNNKMMSHWNSQNDFF